MDAFRRIIRAMSPSADVALGFNVVARTVIFMTKTYVLALMRAGAIDPDSRGTKRREAMLEDDDYGVVDVSLDKVLMHMGVANPAL